MRTPAFVTSGSGPEGPDPRWVEQARRREAPENEAPGLAGGSRVVTRSEDAAVVLGPIEVFSTGLRLELTLVLRRSDVPWADRDAYRRFEEQLLFGAELPGGRRVTREVFGGYGPPWLHPGAGLGDEPALVPHGGSGGGRLVTTRWFLSPAPEPGDLLVVVAVPGAGLPEGRLVVPAAAMAAAREAAVELWPWEPDVAWPTPPPAEPPVPPAGSWFAGGTEAGAAG